MLTISELWHAYCSAAVTANCNR